MSLLELTLATAMMTTVMTSLSVLVRGSYLAWQDHESDLQQVESAHGTVRHILRHLRQAQAVTAITAKSDNVGSLTLRMADDSILVWTRNASANTVNFGTGAPNHLLAEEIYELRFTGFQADGVTETAVPNEIHAVQVTAVVHLDRDANAARTVSCWGWIRSW